MAKVYVTFHSLNGIASWMNRMYDNRFAIGCQNDNEAYKLADNLSQISKVSHIKINHCGRFTENTKVIPYETYSEYL